MEFEFLTDEENKIVDGAAKAASGAIAQSDTYKLHVIILKLAARVSGETAEIPAAYDPQKLQTAALSQIDPEVLRAHLAALDAAKAEADVTTDDGDNVVGGE